MIKFFRNIRQILIMENNTSKYLKYAIGEIVLVVIGILIALQINNWNEIRKTENMGKVFIGEIYAEIKNEISNINDILTALNYQYDGTENVLAIIESSNRIITDTIQFTDNYWAPSRLLIVQRDLNTFDKLRSSGQSGLLKNDSLSNLLDKFYKNFDIRISNFKEFPLQIRMDLRRITFPLGNMNDFLHEEKYDKLTASYLNEYLNNDAVYQNLLAILKTCRYNIRFFNESLVEATNLIDYMELKYPELKKPK